jgi:DNA-binding CsgD family transcriptional regulator
MRPRLINGADQAFRKKAMVELYRAGWILEDIGFAWGLTRERVRQIVNLDGAEVGGQTVRTIGRRMDRLAGAPKCEMASLRVYGCGRARAIELNGGVALSSSKGRAAAYRQQRSSASARGIAWNLPFEDWCAIWDASGRWALRGVGKGKYCMARYGDTGGYVLGNVYIERNEQNASDSYITKPRQAQVAELVHLPTREIAERLGISPTMASQYKCQVKARLAVAA